MTAMIQWRILPATRTARPVIAAVVPGCWTLQCLSPIPPASGAILTRPGTPLRRRDRHAARCSSREPARLVCALGSVFSQWFLLPRAGLKTTGSFWDPSSIQNRHRETPARVPTARCALCCPARLGFRQSPQMLSPGLSAPPLNCNRRGIANLINRRETEYIPAVPVGNVLGRRFGGRL